MATTIRKPRTATPARWQTALQRAIAGNVQVRQLAGSGAWIATSASDPHAAYELEITGNTAHGCSCPAAQLGNDPVCCHRAAWYHAIGALDLDPEPAPPAPAVTAVVVLAERVVWRVVKPNGDLYSECLSEGTARIDLAWLDRCFPSGGSHIVRAVG